MTSSKNKGESCYIKANKGTVTHRDRGHLVKLHLIF